MSKSHPDPKTRISIIDSDDEITAKIKGAQTDSISDVSQDISNRPGIRNLLGIYAGLNAKTEETAVKEFAGQNAKALKERVSQSLIEKIAPIRHRFHSIRKDERLLLEIEELGAGTAKRAASKTLQAVKEVLGLA